MLRHASKLIACCLALSACVTINVYFPAAAAEKAADKIIDGIVGGAAPAEPTKREDDDKQQGAARADSGPQRVLLAAAAYYFWGGNASAAQYLTARVDRGNLRNTVTATGTLQNPRKVCGSLRYATERSS